MKRPITAVLLAGRIRPSPLGETLDLPVLCLPVGREGSLLDVWLDVLGHVAGLQEVLAVVNTQGEVEALNAIAAARGRQRRPALKVVAEPASWRGPAGIVRDVTAELCNEAMVMVCEGRRLPPTSFHALCSTIKSLEPQMAGIVGICGRDEPAGVYAFSRSALELVPAIGYFDLKEQFLPLLRRQDRLVMPCHVGDGIWRLHDLESYLACVRQSLRDSQPRGVRISGHASVSPSAHIEGCCIIEAGAVVEDGAVLHDSVVLWGATVGEGAVVSRSVIGSLAAVSTRQRVVRSIITRTQVWESPSATRRLMAQC